MSQDDKTNRMVERRRELNRQAAQKLRNRQKEKAVNVKQEYFQAQSLNTQLSYQVKQLRKRKEQLAQQYQEHAAQCRRPSLFNRRQMLAAESSSYPTYVVTSEPSAVALQLVHLNSLMSQRANVPTMTAAEISTVHLSSKIDSFDTSSESRSTTAITVEPVNNGTNRVSGTTEQALEEDEMSEGSSINFGGNDLENDAQEALVKEERMLESEPIQNSSPSSTELAEIVVNVDTCSNSMASRDYLAAVPARNGRGPPQVERSNCVSQLPLVVSALSADED